MALATSQLPRPLPLITVARVSNDKWTFFRAFLRSPRVIASVIPSSTFLQRRVISVADPASARVVVELGAGTGVITRSLLRAMDADANLLVIERTAVFVRNLQRIKDHRLDIVHGCASSIGEEMNSRDLLPADAVISGIPFTTLPDELASKIIDAVYDALRPGGRFIAYQFTSRVADHAWPVMGTPEIQHEFRNVPPLRVFVWRKPGHAGEDRDRYGTTVV